MLPLDLWYEIALHARIHPLRACIRLDWTYVAAVKVQRMVRKLMQQRTVSQRVGTCCHVIMRYPWKLNSQRHVRKYTGVVVCADPVMVYVPKSCQLFLASKLSRYMSIRSCDTVIDQLQGGFPSASQMIAATTELSRAALDPCSRIDIPEHIIPEDYNESLNHILQNGDDPMCTNVSPRLFLWYAMHR